MPELTPGLLTGIFSVATTIVISGAAIWKARVESEKPNPQVEIARIEQGGESDRHSVDQIIELVQEKARWEAKCIVAEGERDVLKREVEILQKQIDKIGPMSAIMQKLMDADKDNDIGSIRHIRDMADDILKENEQQDAEKPGPH